MGRDKDGSRTVVHCPVSPLHHGLIRLAPITTQCIAQSYTRIVPPPFLLSKAKISLSKYGHLCAARATLFYLILCVFYVI